MNRCTFPVLYSCTNTFTVLFQYIAPADSVWVATFCHSKPRLATVLSKDSEIISELGRELDRSLHPHMTFLLMGDALSRPTCKNTSALALTLELSWLEAIVLDRIMVEGCLKSAIPHCTAPPNPRTRDAYKPIAEILHTNVHSRCFVWGPMDSMTYLQNAVHLTRDHSHLPPTA